MAWAAVAGAAVGVVGGALASSGSGGGGGGGSGGAAAAADPFAAQRAQYQQQLSDLMKNPSSITSDPGYQFQLGEGLGAVNGAMAQGGYLNSGNRLTALQKEGQDFASTQLQNKELFLAQLAGANVGSPGEAGAILQQQNQANQQAGGIFGNALGQGVSSLVSSFNTGSGSGGGSYNFSMPSGFSNSGFGTSGSSGGNSWGFNSGIATDPTAGYIPGSFGV